MSLDVVPSGTLEPKGGNHATLPLDRLAAQGDHVEESLTGWIRLRDLGFCRRDSGAPRGAGHSRHERDLNVFLAIGWATETPRFMLGECHRAKCVIRDTPMSRRGDLAG
jgi:hypothetical protein